MRPAASIRPSNSRQRRLWSFSNLFFAILVLISIWLMTSPILMYFFSSLGAGDDSDSNTNELPSEPTTDFGKWVWKQEQKQAGDVVRPDVLSDLRWRKDILGKRASITTAKEGEDDSSKRSLWSATTSNEKDESELNIGKQQRESQQINKSISEPTTKKPQQQQKKPRRGSNFHPVTNHPNSGMFFAKATKKNYGYMEMLEERAVPKADRSHVTLGENAGRLCNQLLSLATLFTKAKQNNWRIGLWGMWRQTVENNFDLDLLRSYGVEFYFADHRPESAVRLPAAGEGGCSVRKVLTWLKTYVRPNQRLKQKAENILDELRETGDGVVAVHRRWFEGACHLMYRKGVSHCHLDSSHTINPDWVCNYTLGPQLEDVLYREWPEMKSVTSIGMYLSTDSQMNASDDTFFDPRNKFPKLKRVMRSGYKVTPNLKHENPPADETMLVDMWISTLADFYLASPLSSCDQIVAQWRGELFPNQVNMHPLDCYDKFAIPKTHDDSVCIGINSCTCHW